MSNKLIKTINFTLCSALVLQAISSSLDQSTGPHSPFFVALGIRVVCMVWFLWVWVQELALWSSFCGSEYGTRIGVSWSSDHYSHNPGPHKPDDNKLRLYHDPQKPDSAACRSIKPIVQELLETLIRKFQMNP